MNLAGRWQIRQSNKFVVDVTMKQQGDRLGAFCTTRRLRQLVLLIVTGAYIYFQQISTWIEVPLKEIESTGELKGKTIEVDYQVEPLARMNTISFPYKTRSEPRPRLLHNVPLVWQNLRPA